jgi:hypothetical protein
MKSKLGLYVINTGDAPIAWFAKAQPRIVVSMDHNLDYWQNVKSVSPNTFILGRHYFDTQVINGAQWFNAMLSDANHMRGVYDAWMSINEPAILNQQDAINLQAETFVWSNYMHKIGIKTAAYSFGEGHPDLALLPFLKNHACDYYSRHEYDAPEMWRTQTWRCLRYRREREFFPQPFIISEAGIDGGVTGVDKPQRGWREFGNEQHYLESLKWYDSEISKDDYLIGAAIFAAKWDTGQGSFDMIDCNSIRDYIGQTK